MGLTGTPLRRKNMLLMLLFVIVVPFTILFLVIGPGESFQFPCGIFLEEVINRMTANIPGDLCWIRSCEKIPREEIPSLYPITRQLKLSDLFVGLRQFHSSSSLLLICSLISCNFFCPSIKHINSMAVVMS